MSDSFIEVPPPLYKYQGDDEIHDDNKKVIAAHEADRKTILSKKVVKRLKSELKALEQSIKETRADERVGKYDELLQEYNSNRIRLQSDDLPEDDFKHISSEVRRQHAKLKQMRDKVQPLQRRLQKRNKIRSMLEAHVVAVDEQKKENELLLMMAKEADIIADQMSHTLSRVGFSYTDTINEKTVTDYVEWDHVVTTPDQHQFKVAASRRGLAGGSIELLPQGVKVTDILQPWVMAELSTTLEREVWSPHVDEDVKNTNGAWIIVERMGLYEGIPKLVTYRQLMARYETADHSRIPIPAGLKRGRRVNWTYLDSHSSTHIMFTGITGSGKTVAVQASIAAVVERQSPRDAMFAIIDLKNQGDFNELSDSPHMMRWGDDGHTIVSQVPEVVKVLEKIRDEMHWRQKRIGSVAKNINQYNKRVSECDRLPRIIILFDEYANTRRGRFSEEAAIIDDICTEITQIGRASGIHLWIGIQQPRASNMPPALRDNFTTLFVGHQANVGASQSVTGNRSSLKLADIPGRMMAFSGWKSFEVQMPLITDDDIDEAVKLAVEAYGDLEPYQLHILDDDERPDEPMSERELVIATAWDNLQGGLKVAPLHGLLKEKMSRNAIKQIVDMLAAEQTVTVDGEIFNVVKKPGNFYQMEIADSSTSDEGKQGATSSAI